jgi:hypothetical protein
MVLLQNGKRNGWGVGAAHEPSSPPGAAQRRGDPGNELTRARNAKQEVTVSPSLPFALVDVFADVRDDVRAAPDAAESRPAAAVVHPGRGRGGRRRTQCAGRLVVAGYDRAGRLDADGGALLAQEIGDRVLPVEVPDGNGRPEAIVMEQARPEFGRTLTDHGELAAALGLDPGRVLDDVPAPAAPPARSSAAWSLRA